MRQGCDIASETDETIANFNIESQQKSVKLQKKTGSTIESFVADRERFFIRKVSFLFNEGESGSISKNLF